MGGIEEAFNPPLLFPHIANGSGVKFVFLFLVLCPGAGKPSFLPPPAHPLL